MNTDHQPGPAWFAKLIELINSGFNPDDTATGGAQLIVYEPDGTKYGQRPLARHARLDHDCVWIRPIVGHGPGFDLNFDCRRRGLTTTLGVTHDDTSVTFQLADGASAHVVPADEDQVAALDAWDTFMLLTLTAQQEASVEALEADSGY